VPRVAATEKNTGSAAEYLPPTDDLEEVRLAAGGCKACDLWMKGTQTVFGQGPARTEVMLVGEQPGDVEDVRGAPFVGPAGRLLDKALEEAGLDRKSVYLTNAVKHFNWEETRGKRRIHKKPGARHIGACRPWLEAEIALVRPRVIVALGAVAAQSLLGRDFKVMKHRGEAIESEWGIRVVVTVHPSSILRAPTDAARREAIEAFIHDLRRAAAMVEPAAVRA
jgi:uracil-DNA glycosylase family protein